MHMATGVRTKHYNCFNVVMCKSVQKIKIHYTQQSFFSKKVSVEINGAYFAFCNLNTGVYEGKIEKLVRNDGFDSVEDFFDWFNKDFEGKIIHWTYLRY